MAEEADVIQHLIEVERNAAQIMIEAQKEADDIVAQSRVQAEEQFKEKYAIIARRIDEQEASRRDEISKKHSTSLSSYKESLDSYSKDKASFNKLLDKVLFS